jgi:hypothetical protein
LDFRLRSHDSDVGVPRFLLSPFCPLSAEVCTVFSIPYKWSHCDVLSILWFSGCAEFWMLTLLLLNTAAGFIWCYILLVILEVSLSLGSCLILQKQLKGHSSWRKNHRPGDKRQVRPSSVILAITWLYDLKLCLSWLQFTNNNYHLLSSCNVLEKCLTYIVIFSFHNGLKGQFLSVWIYSWGKFSFREVEVGQPKFQLKSLCLITFLLCVLHNLLCKMRQLDKCSTILQEVIGKHIN